MLQSCDTMVALGNATRHGQTIFAKNSDRPPDECQPLILQASQAHQPGATIQCQFLNLPQVEQTYRHVGSRPYWCWGYEHGFNEHQVVIGNEALPSRLPAFGEPKLIGMELLRLGLERARTAAEAIEVMTSLITHYGQGKFENEAGVRTYDNGYIVADPKEAYALETAGHEWAVKRIENALGISNVYAIETDWHQLSPAAESAAMGAGWWPQMSNGSTQAERFNFATAYSKTGQTNGSGAMRRARSCAVLQHRTGGIDARMMMSLLSDHGDGQANPANFQTTINPGTGICVHASFEGSAGNTAASLVAELCADGSRLPIYWCSFYSPCLGLFFPVFLEGDLPPILTIGGGTPSQDSPWWLFYQLSRLVQQNDRADRVSMVREEWAILQNKLFSSAYQMAIEGRELIDAGQSDTARQLLSNYMAKNVSEMLAMVARFLQTFEIQAAEAV